MSFQHLGNKFRHKNKLFTSGGICQIKCGDFPKVIYIDKKFNNTVVLEKIIEIYSSSIPVCWNYLFDEYPPEYLKKVPQEVIKKMSYSQEFCENSFDSNGENNVNSYNMIIYSINTRQNLIATDAMIVNKLCEILSYFTTKEDKLKLYNILVQSGNHMFSEKLPMVSNKLKKNENEYESLHLPLVKSKQSKQLSFFSAKRKK